MAIQTVFDGNYEDTTVKRQNLPYVGQEGIGQNRGIAPLILIHGNRYRWVINCTTLPPFSRERTPVSLKLEEMWASEKIWTFREIEKSLAPTGIRTQKHAARSVITPTKLSRNIY